MHLVMGRLAQLVERFVYTEDVGGSSPSSPTTLPVPIGDGVFRNSFHPKFNTASTQASDRTAAPSMAKGRVPFSGNGESEKAARVR